MYIFAYIKTVIKTYNQFRLNNKPIRDIFKIFDVSKSTLYKWLKIYKDHPQINESDKNIFTIKGNYKKRQRDNIGNAVIEHIIECVKNNPQIISRKIKEKMEQKFGESISTSHISRILRENNYTYKKVQKENMKVKTEQFKVDKERLKKQIQNKENRDIVSLDEARYQLGQHTNYGRSIKNTKCIVNVKGRQKRR